MNFQRWMGFFPLFLLLGVLPVGASYYDQKASSDLREVFTYLDEVEKEIGTEVYESVRFDNLLHVARRLGSIDHYSMTPSLLIEHVQSGEKVEKRFYTAKPLSRDEVKSYILPHRIRYEPTSRPDWMKQLHSHFGPMVEDATSAEQAMARVWEWMSSNLTIEKKEQAYPLPTRGDLDPVTVLRGRYGEETDIAIFGVASLRSIGVAARLVWAPALRGEPGGKMWLEYRGENGDWNPLVPLYGNSKNHRSQLLEEFQGKIAFLLTNPEAPFLVTENYLDTAEVTISGLEEDVSVSVLLFTQQELLPGLDPFTLPVSSRFRVGKGLLVISVGLTDRQFSLIPLNISPTTSRVEIEMVDQTPQITLH